MPAKKKTSSKKITLPFEEAVEELEKITHNLEGEAISIENLLDNFERGQDLLKHCHTTLKTARKRLKVVEAQIQDDFEEEEEEEEKNSSSAKKNQLDDDVRLF